MLFSGAHDSIRDPLLRRLGERFEWIRHHARADRELQVTTTTRYLCMHVSCHVCSIDSLVVDVTVWFCSYAVACAYH
jgi:hypothetical protein